MKSGDPSKTAFIKVGNISTGCPLWARGGTDIKGLCVKVRSETVYGSKINSFILPKH